MDASVVFVLARLRLMSALPRLQLEVIVPRMTLDELKKSQSHALVSRGRAMVVEADLNRVPVEFRLRLGEGELSVLAYCLENRKHWAILDDLAARESAAELNLKYAGTARLLRFMAQQGSFRENSLS